MSAAASLALAYGLGCVSFALLAARVRGVDLRAQGSGNPGATNVRRILGRGWGLAVLLLDMGKGLAAVLLLSADPAQLGISDARPGWLVDEQGRTLVAAAVVVGHVWPVNLVFRGGKGVATLVGAFLGLDVLLALFAIAVHVLARLASGFVSVASVLLAWSFPLLQLLLAGSGAGGGRFTQGSATLALLAVVVTIRHRDNFRKIRAGTEDRYDDPSDPPPTRTT